jgi:hypothetical protein
MNGNLHSPPWNLAGQEQGESLCWQRGIAQVSVRAYAVHLSVMGLILLEVEANPADQLLRILGAWTYKP